VKQKPEPKSNCICLLSVKRTGSNHLCSVLGNYQRVAAFYELFEAGGSWGLRTHVPVPLVTIWAKNRVTDPALIRFVNAHPRLFLNRVARVCRFTGKPVMIFKILAGQLTYETIKSEVLGRPGTRAMLISRRAIDSFVSEQKALMLSEWLSVDTTGVKVEVDAGEYADWHHKAAAWYQHWIEHYRALGQGLPIIRYEDVIDAELNHTLDRFSALAREIGFDLKPKPEMKKTGLKRQDRTRNAQDKVSNWAAFERGLSRRGLDEAAFGHFV